MPLPSSTGSAGAVFELAGCALASVPSLWRSWHGGGRGAGGGGGSRRSIATARADYGNLSSCREKLDLSRERFEEEFARKPRTERVTLNLPVAVGEEPPTVAEREPPTVAGEEDPLAVESDEDSS